ncbi:RNA polymerase subunit sigma [Micromonospora sp. S4605]|uniref:sigma-70 family RNA polymerase sigma factor n=1 Tax=Micromonospora sp. S4605 TaxID=1420897 RepID=UPI000D6F8361|nr:sigma-70 family RNA polymerase sigma factor [Micromonospora sp. S4605]PWU54788.1 RNA polymerase subunit sigma [Micromonospora sp. S4605]
MNELRTILDRRGDRQTQSLVADFVARHRLTHRDVNALLVALTQHDVTAAPETFVAAAKADGTDDDFAADEPVAAVLGPIGAPGTGEPYTTAESAEANAPDDDLAWMFGEEEPEIPAPRAADDLVGRALDDLLGDWARTGGQLTRAEVAVLATKRRLSPAQHGELLALLEQAGVDLPDPTDVRPRRAAPKGYEFHGDSVGQYLRAISRYPLIDASREVELWSLISDGIAAQEELDAAGDGRLARTVRRSLQTRAVAGRRAHAELVCANLRLVVSIAKARHYEFSGVEFADRIQDGNLGLMRAADKFDGSKGFKFSTYATWWIKQSIERGIGDRGRLIRVPVHVHDQLQKVRRAVSKLTARLDREPSLAEISDMTGMEPGKVQWALDLMQPVRSLDALLGDDGDLRLSDVLAREEERDGRTDPAEIVLHARFHADMARTLRTILPERAVRIVERRFGLGTGEEETLEDIAVDYGVTRERIRQIQSKSLAKLRESGEAAGLWSYLGDNRKAGWSGGSVGRTAS